MQNKKGYPSLNTLLLHNERTLNKVPYLRQPKQGKWTTYTWGEVVRQARRVAAFLLASGFRQGDKIAICSKNCAQWYIADFGISLAGMITVPLFPNQRNESIHFVLEHAEVASIFVGKVDEPSRIMGCIPKIMTVMSFGYLDTMPNAIAWEKIMATPPLEKVFLPEPDDIFSIIYTSGTSGALKGVVYTHGIIARYLALYVDDIKKICDLTTFRFLSYLPLAHIYERAAIELGSVVLFCTVSFVESLDKFADNLRYVRPTFFTAVPRIWAVFHNRINKKIPEKRLNFLLKIPIVSYIIKRKIKQSMGFCHCKNFFSGASHLPLALQEYFDKLGIRIQEGYGQSENLAYCTVSRLYHYRPGFVGTARSHVEIKLSEHSELLVKSPCLMQAYFKDKAATLDALNKDGWLHTGDIAEIDKENRVKIIDRLSDIFKNQFGEFISPGEIEELFSAIPYFEQLCLIGKNIPENVLLVALSQTGHLLERELLMKNIQLSIKQINHQLMRYERVSKILIVSEEWSPENGFLTPTFKIRRTAVESYYRKKIEKIVQEPGFVFWDI